VGVAENVKVILPATPLSPFFMFTTGIYFHSQ
jgi:hypothetical protein